MMLKMVWSLSLDTILKMLPLDNDLSTTRYTISHENLPRGGWFVWCTVPLCLV